MVISQHLQLENDTRCRSLHAICIIVKISNIFASEIMFDVVNSEELNIFLQPARIALVGNSGSGKTSLFVRLVEKYKKKNSSDYRNRW